MASQQDRLTMVRPGSLSWIIAFSFIMSLLPAISQAQEQKTIWDREILPQPFEKQPFQQVAIPGWLQDTLGCGYTLSVMSSQQRELAVKHGVRLSEMGFVDPFCTYYDSKFLKRRNPHVAPDRLESDPGRPVSTQGADSAKYELSG